MTLGALGNVWMALAEPDVFYQFGLRPSLLVVTALLYGLSAGVTAVGLWRVAPWTLKAFLAWSIVVIAGSFAFALDVEMPGTATWLPFGSVVLLVAILTLVALYIHRRIGTRV